MPCLGLKDIHRLKAKGWKRYSANGNQRKAGMGLLMPEKQIDFKSKTV